MKMGDLGDLSVTNVTEPRETDVICGRGGAALRHPGNQNYRRLVNMNKALYITCLKTEKLKISRSIVAAIREQKGRFLEKDTDKATWYDIGDKKAVEKTSQALREGQPKLRAKIVEMGGVDAETASMIESQYGQNQPGVAHNNPNNNTHRYGSASADHDGRRVNHMESHRNAALPHQTTSQHQTHQQQQQSSATRTYNQADHDAAVAAATAAAMRQQDMHVMQPPIPRHDQHSLMLERLSLRDVQGPPEIHQQYSPSPYSPRKMRPGMMSMSNRAAIAQELGVAESQLSLLSDLSAVGESFGSIPIHPGHPNNESLMSIDGSFRRNFASINNSDKTTIQHPTAPSSSSGIAVAASRDSVNSNNTLNNRDKLAGMDRRRVFAKMKYTRPPSVRAHKGTGVPGQLSQNSNHSIGETLPEIHMVESSMSIYSNLSNMTGGGGGGGNGGTETSQKQFLADGKTQVEVGKLNLDNSNHHHHHHHHNQIHPVARDHAARMNAFPDALGGSSRHSLMSGLSRISDSSGGVHSIFSDLSKKIGNVSTRSIAMSEISAFELNEKDEEEEAIADTATSGGAGMASMAQMYGLGHSFDSLGTGSTPEAMRNDH